MKHIAQKIDPVVKSARALLGRLPGARPAPHPVRVRNARR